jgi:hypothetical protein
MRKVIAFSGLAGGLAYCFGRQLNLAIPASSHLTATSLLVIGGAFTLAIAVFIRD